MKLVNPVLAAEVVKQLVKDRNEGIGEIIRELINTSGILDSKAYITRYMTLKIRDLLVRRKKVTDDFKEQSEFSPLIEYLLGDDKHMAFILLQETSKKFKSGLIAQQLARLYKAEKNFEEAERYAKVAIDLPEQQLILLGYTWQDYHSTDEPVQEETK